VDVETVPDVLEYRGIAENIRTLSKSRSALPIGI
jgi:hypothetical protein